MTALLPRPEHARNSLKILVRLVLARKVVLYDSFSQIVHETKSVVSMPEWSKGVGLRPPARLLRGFDPHSKQLFSFFSQICFDATNNKPDEREQIPELGDFCDSISH